MRTRSWLYSGRSRGTSGGPIKALLLAAAVTGCASTNDAIAFERVNVVPMTPGSTVLPDQTVIVRDGRIEVVGPAGTTAAPRGALRIDGRGRYLMPGLADMHVHLEHSRNPAILGLFLASGVTTVRNMDGRPWILEWREDVASGALHGPVIHTAGPILDGDPPLRDDNVSLATAEEAHAEVRRQAAAGYDFIKVYVNLDSAVYDAIVRASAEAGMRVAGHVPRSVGLDAVLRARPWSVEHLGDFATAIEADDSPFRGAFHWSRLFLGMPADSVRMRAVAQHLQLSGAWLVPTLIERDRALAPPDVLAMWMSDPAVTVIDKLEPGAVAMWHGQVQGMGARMGDEDWFLYEQGRSNRLALTKIMYDEGVRIVAGTDTPNPFVLPGMALHEELAAFIEAGIPVAEAFAAATRDAARFLGEADEWGTVQAGRRADLLLLADNPLLNPGAAAAPLGVMAAGRWFDEVDLQRLRSLQPACGRGGCSRTPARLQLSGPQAEKQGEPLLGPVVRR